MEGQKTMKNQKTFKIQKTDIIILVNLINFRMIGDSLYIKKHKKQMKSTEATQKFHTTSMKIFRKQERSLSKNSNKSSSRQEQSESIPSFFVKPSDIQRFLKKNCPEVDSQEQKSIIKRDDTPVKKKKHTPKIQNNEKSVAMDQLRMVEIETQLQITELERKVHEKDSTIDKYKKKILESEKHMDDKNRKFNDMKTKLHLVQREKQILEDKVEKLQKQILESQTNLKQANSNLEKLRISIKQNQITDLKKTNQFLNLKVLQLSKEVEVLKQEISFHEERIQMLDEQNRRLQNRTSLQMQIKTQSMREKYLQKQLNKLKEEKFGKKSHIEKILQERIQHLTQENYILSKEIKGLSIKLNYIQRRNMEQFHSYIKAKSEEIKIQRQRYSKLYKNYRDLKMQLEQKTSKNNHLKPNGHGHRRAVSSISLMMEKQNPKTSLTLSLSSDE